MVCCCRHELDVVDVVAHYWIQWHFSPQARRHYFSSHAVDVLDAYLLDDAHNPLWPVRDVLSQNGSVLFWRRAVGQHMIGSISLGHHVVDLIGRIWRRRRRYFRSSRPMVMVKASWLSR